MCILRIYLVCSRRCIIISIDVISYKVEIEIEVQITSQVLWRLLLPPLLEFLKDSDREIYDNIIAIKTDHVSIELAVEMLQTDAVRQKRAEFKATSRDSSLVFWMSYLDMVSTLLMFTRAERDGI